MSIITYDYFHNLIIDWFQGNKTRKEIIQLTQKELNLSDDAKFPDDFEDALQEYNKDFYFYWLEDKEKAKNTAPTIQGLVYIIETHSAFRLYLLLDC